MCYKLGRDEEFVRLGVGVRVVGILHAAMLQAARNFVAWSSWELQMYYCSWSNSRRRVILASYAFNADEDSNYG